LCLTGTPIENNIGELWTLFDTVMPGFLGTYRQLKKYLKQYPEDGLNILAKRINPFILRIAIFYVHILNIRVDIS
jgi:non-specific serine/threonine protein kinase